MDRKNDICPQLLPMPKRLEEDKQLCPDAAFTLELMESEQSVNWLIKWGLL